MISYFTGLILNKSPGFVVISVQVIDLTVFDCSWDVAMTTNFGAKSAKLAYSTFVYRTNFPKRIVGFNGVDLSGLLGGHKRRAASRGGAPVGGLKSPRS